jgi:lipoprotein NlpD
VKPAKAVALLVLLALLAGCASRRTPAPVVDARSPRAATSRPAPPAPPAAAPQPAPQPAGDFYAVRRGDTLYSIALEHGADYRELAQWNSLDDPTKLRVGQQLRVKAPESERQAAQVGSARIGGRVESRPLESLPQPLPPSGQVVQRPEPPTAAVVLPAVAPAQFPLFVWPVRGKVLSEFAEPRRKGIDIDGKPGEPIVAAAAGRVTYIGTGIPGMGKLVVIKHENGFITVYAHNRDIMVKEQQAVARGQKIAELGSTDSERPKLHFQIRKGASAVDPLLYLPKT